MTSTDFIYGKLEDQLINLFYSGIPDFNAAEKLIEAGADINAEAASYSSNMLADILGGYWSSCFGDYCETLCDLDADFHDIDRCCKNCIHNINPHPGQSLCGIIRFFLDHGFDLSKNNDRYGAQCLWELHVSCFDRGIIDATKLLLDAGAKNISIDPDDDYETPYNSMCGEYTFLSGCEWDPHLSNMYHAVLCIYDAVKENCSYDGIDSYDTAAGKKILKVLAQKEGNTPVFFPIDTPSVKYQNYFNTTLYFIYDGGALMVDQYANLWVNTSLPDKHLIDVSEYFDGIVGSIISGFSFDHVPIVKDITTYSRTRAIVETTSGFKVSFQDNFGEADDANRAAYYNIIKPD